MNEDVRLVPLTNQEISRILLALDRDPARDDADEACLDALSWRLMQVRGQGQTKHAGTIDDPDPTPPFTPPRIMNCGG